MKALRWAHVFNLLFILEHVDMGVVVAVDCAAADLLIPNIWFIVRLKTCTTQISVFMATTSQTLTIITVTGVVALVTVFVIVLISFMSYASVL
jgi:hypothetical protein